AFKYRSIIEKINELTDRNIQTINIVGGGSQNDLLNQFTANATGIKVVAGPVEATAFGNIMVQAIAKGKIKDIKEGREIIKNSVELKKYLPIQKDIWERKYQESNQILEKYYNVN
ncbi:MAG: rhamnulokinase, partial [Bacteroidetes bacterium]|nr:rhamnulokinase [Bacteroidota bacterium]